MTRNPDRSTFIAEFVKYEIELPQLNEIALLANVRYTNGELVSYFCWFNKTAELTDLVDLLPGEII